MYTYWTVNKNINNNNLVLTVNQNLIAINVLFRKIYTAVKVVFLTMNTNCQTCTLTVV